MTKKIVLCDCLGSQKVNADIISDACGMVCSKVFTSLCAEQVQDAAREISSGEVIVACQQERQHFADLAEEVGCATPGFVDIRDRAGWGEGDPNAKMAALLAEAALEVPINKTIDVVSHGVCLIIGGAEAIKAATELCDILAVTVLLPDASNVPSDRRFDCVVGQLRKATGALGDFRVTIDALQEVIPGGRGAFALTDPRNGAVSECDIILDLSGAPAMFPAPEKREGYLRGDPSYAPSAAKAILQASQLFGTFEKPLYVHLEPMLCAHSRAEKPACSNCLNACPTGAITSAGDHVAIDPMICAGCGSCSAVCPSGAVRYDAPPVDSIFKRLCVMADTYREAGGRQPRLMVHDQTHGREMIALSARYGRGLPADVIPLEVEALSGFGHAETLAAIACGFGHVDILMSPRAERDVIEGQVELTQAIAGAASVRILEPQDPDAMSEALYHQTTPVISCDPVLPMGTRRQVARLSAKTIQPDAEVIALPENAPYGAVLVDTDACTLCLSCVSLCPSGALGENPDMPQLRFQEDACLQCGLCTNVCPENAITLKPQLNLTDTAFNQVILHEEEPFACIECGALFGVKSTVERITEKLAGNHSMFGSPQAVSMIQMCEDCRIQAQFHSKNNPFESAERPKVRTTEDYLSKRKDH